MHKITCILIVGMFAITSQAAVINWGAPQTIASDTDVITGSVSNAYAVTFAAPAGPATTINGVTFDAANTAGNANITPTGWNGVAQTWSAFTGPTASTLSANYQTLLGGGLYVDPGAAAAAASITLNNLINGDDYQVQIWAHRSDAGANGAAILDVYGNLLDADNDGGANDPIGQLITGTFTADATTQVLDSFDGSVQYAILNGINVVAIPEPATISLLAAFGGALCFIRRKLTISE